MAPAAQDAGPRGVEEDNAESRAAHVRCVCVVEGKLPHRYGLFDTVDSTHEPSKSAPQRWGKFLQIECQRTSRPEEFGEILRHQLSAPLRIDLEHAGPAVPHLVKALAQAELLKIQSFADLLRHPHPPIDLLKLIKDYAKCNRDHPDSHLPGEVAAVIYYLSIVAAWLRCGQKITRLSDQDLQEGVDWVLNLSWVDEETKATFREGPQFLARPGPI